MTKCEEIKDLLKNREFETLNIEVKSFDLLESRELKKKILKQMVAFANRDGGKVIFGVRNDGTIEGSFPYNIDDIKEKIDNYVQNGTSPLIRYGTELLKCNNFDLFVIKVDRKLDIPHAYIVSRDGPEIKNRIYYVRTPHGSKPVSDEQLRFLFKQEDYNFSTPFTVAIMVELPNYNIPFQSFLPQCDSITNYYRNLIAEILPQDFENKLKQFDLTFGKLTYKFTPIFMLHSILRQFSRSWDLKFEDKGSSRRFNYSIKSPPSKTIIIEKVIKNNIYEILDLFSINYKDLLKLFFIEEFFVPPNTELKILDGDTFLNLSNDIYSVEIKRIARTSGHGFDQTHPYYGRYFRRSAEDQIKLREKYYYVRIDFMLNIQLGFPPSDIEYFELYPKFLNNIRRIIENEWDYYKFIQTLPDPMFFSLEDQINEILRLLREK